MSNQREITEQLDALSIYHFLLNYTTLEEMIKSLYVQKWPDFSNEVQQRLMFYQGGLNMQKSFIEYDTYSVVTQHHKFDVEAMLNNLTLSSYVRPQHVFLGKAVEIGYELGKKNYKPHNKNDFAEFEYMMSEIFQGLRYTSNKAECGWIDQTMVSSYRIDANYLMNKINSQLMKEQYGKVVPLGEVCTIENNSVNVKDDVDYYYLEVPDISPQTGTITNIRRVKGRDIGDSFHKFYTGDILFTRINPRISRVAIAPELKEYGIVSKEVYRIVYKDNAYINEKNKYVICALLQNENVIKQIVRLSTGSSSSRARVQVEDLLNDVYIPILSEKAQKQISDSIYQMSKEIWDQAQKLLETYQKNQELLGSKIDINEFRGI